MGRAKTEDEIKPLLAMCKAGMLFEVQDWISAGRPIDRPVPSAKGNRRKSPLQIAIDLGFHSLVRVLLEGQASLSEPRYSALEHALEIRRLDLVKLLVDQGAEIHSVDMTLVFDTWDPQIIEYFIEGGADVESGFPLARAFIVESEPR
jgi:hypothetical protein